MIATLLFNYIEVMGGKRKKPANISARDFLWIAAQTFSFGSCQEAFRHSYCPRDVLALTKREPVFIPRYRR